MLVTYMRDIQNVSARTEKERLLKEVTDKNPEFVRGFKRALDTYETFGVKKLPKHNHSNNTVADFDELFHDTLNMFASRKVTGNAAQDALDLLMQSCSKDDWEYFYSRILIKDMKCGLSIATWNKVLPADNKVSVFACQLAHDGANHEKKMTGEKLVEVKLDGVRVIAIVRTNGNVRLYSRNGKELNNFPVIEQQLATLVPYINTDMVFDGEVMSSSFQDLMRQVHRKESVQTDDAVLYLFDNVSLSEFKSGKSSVPQIVRSQELQNILEAVPALTNIERVEQVSVDLATQIGQRIFRELNKKAIDGGYEGIMLKDPTAPYECKRSHAWLKIKPYIEVTLEVIGVEEGTGKNRGLLGALVCRGTDDGRDITVNVGSGFSDSNRNDIWNDRLVNDKSFAVIGQLVEVRADAITQNQNGTYSLRFPRFKCFRGFNPGEKI